MKQINNDYSFQKISLGVLLLLFCFLFGVVWVFFGFVFQSNTWHLWENQQKATATKEIRKKGKDASLNTSALVPTGRARNLTA